MLSWLPCCVRKLGALVLRVRDSRVEVDILNAEQEWAK
jgi:hypothetical protein